MCKFNMIKMCVKVKLVVSMNKGHLMPQTLKKDLSPIFSPKLPESK